MNRELYRQAVHAALAASEAAKKEPIERRGKLMERAARATFKRAGTSRDAADVYACCITADILERERRSNARIDVEQLLPPDPFPTIIPT